MFKPYKSYNFKDKDPIIDTMRTIVQNSGVTYRDIQDASGVSTSCLWGWFNGATRRPSHAAIVAVAHSLGYQITITRQTGEKIGSQVVHLKAHLKARKRA